ncbi:MAG: formylglycine-generating enzyme family protein [Pirellulales bacterium]
MTWGGVLARWYRKGSDPPPAPVGPFVCEAPLAPVDPTDEFALAQRIIHEGRYAILLDVDAEAVVSDDILVPAWEALEAGMALIPGGRITLGPPEDGAAPAEDENELPPLRETVDVEPFYLDRFAVTNAQFAQFIAGGGYEQMDLWPQEIWPSVVQFTDQTGHPGPRRWSEGRPPRGKEDHPVTGVSWFEATAYASWVGKRLPTGAEWEKAGSWPADLGGRGPKHRYPWGNAFEPHRTNTWPSGREDTVPAGAYREGCTPNGIYQLVGNVWEWLADRYEGPRVKEGLRVLFDHPMREIRGGAFDTYLETEATCYFRTGQPELDRRNNIGFRCALSAARLRGTPGSIRRSD